MSTTGSSQPMDPAAQATFNYAQQVNAQSGNTGGLFGTIFSAIDSLAGAAQAGQFAVDGDTAKVINDKLTEIKNIALSAKAKFLNLQQMPIGGGYAQQISQRNQQISVGGPDSASGQMLAFANNLDKLIEAINSSVAGYQSTDQQAHGDVRRAGNY
ncbi:hypothetical protein [Kutzneria buriramensis]|uniref:Uncharacterized protein n=1 Tax=Kutzneria buriramensis TaxID=1045776 RepID=A0A3E0HV47_9PSEU|nr:hypothetical protein [Kutzneria buriramensis]REH50308.1 hypothetical protein BCF44_104585 [Kutzneria buriramensis]